MVLGHMTRGGDSLKEAADYLNGISSISHAHGGVTEQAVFTEVFKKLTEVCLTIMELGEADTCGTSDMMHHMLDMSDPEVHSLATQLHTTLAHTFGYAPNTPPPLTNTTNTTTTTTTMTHQQQQGSATPTYQEYHLFDHDDTPNRSLSLGSRTVGGPFTLGGSEREGEGDRQNGERAGSQRDGSFL
mmetsp:Transcript_11236/g.32573  ORF Transcript_11236/g.32573 Transcript_11236/m.32573 type:complete len:186 (-) Transcript_11236:4849-5406(-)